MNEKIKELELQCWEPTQYGPAWFNSTKFAELIVRQCVKSTIALQNTAIDNEWGLDETFHIIVDDMVEQFDMQHIFRS
jgi:hypothetical protein